MTSNIKKKIFSHFSEKVFRVKLFNDVNFRITKHQICNFKRLIIGLLCLLKKKKMCQNCYGN